MSRLVEAAKLPNKFFNLTKKPAAKKTVVKAPAPKLTKPLLVKHVEPKPKATKPKEAKGPKPLKSWKGGDKKTFYEIELVRDGKGHSINTYVSNHINPTAKQKSSSYMPKLSDDEAVAKYNDYVKMITTAKGLTVKKSIVNVKARLIAKQKANQMSVEDKLAVFAKKTVPVKKKRNSKQVLTGLKNTGKKILKMEARIKEKMDALKKEQEKIKALKAKLHGRIKKHLARMSDAKSRKAGAISPGKHNVKVPKQDLSKAIKKKPK
jgi:hypothetical protein